MCPKRFCQCDQCSLVGKLIDERGSFPVPPATEPQGEEPGSDSIRDSHVAVRSDQVAIDLDEPQPLGKSHLPVEGVPGFPASVFGSSASVGVQGRRSLIMAGETSLAIFPIRRDLRCCAPGALPKVQKKPTWESIELLRHVGLLFNEPPGSAGLSFISSSDHL